MKSEELLALGVFGHGTRLSERVGLLLARGRVFSPRVSRARMTVSAAALLGCVLAGAIAPKVVAFAQARPAFEAASVRPSAGNALDVERAKNTGANIRFGMRLDPERFSGAVVTVRALILRAYRVRDYQLSGGPEWLSRDAFDVEGKAEHAVSEDQLMLMLQSLLADRFKLTLHRETKDLPVYALVAGKNESKLREGPIAEDVGNSVRFGMMGPQMRLTGKQAPMRQLALWLSSILMQSGRPVMDETGLAGGYDFQLQWLPEDSHAEVAAPSVFTAVREQLGLELRATKEATEILVIDHAEKPDEN